MSRTIIRQIDVCVVQRVTGGADNCLLVVQMVVTDHMPHVTENITASNMQITRRTATLIALTSLYLCSFAFLS